MLGHRPICANFSCKLGGLHRLARRLDRAGKRGVGWRTGKRPEPRPPCERGRPLVVFESGATDLATAFDQAGNRTMSDPVTVEVDNPEAPPPPPPPVETSVTPEADATVRADKPSTKYQRRRRLRSREDGSHSPTLVVTAAAS